MTIFAKYYSGLRVLIENSVWFDQLSLCYAFASVELILLFGLLSLEAKLLRVTLYQDSSKTQAADEAVGIGKAHGLPDDMPVEVSVTEGTPVTYNDPELASRLNAVMKRDLGDTVVVVLLQVPIIIIIKVVVVVGVVVLTIVRSTTTTCRRGR